MNAAAGPRPLALSDLHVGYSENREIVKELHPVPEDGDWLLVAGDVAETFADIEWALATLRERFGAVTWVPGNHELWTHPRDSVSWRGDERYRRLIAMCRRLDVVTPEDPYRVWTGPGRPVTIAPLFLLYDYSFRPEGMRTKRPWRTRTGPVSSALTKRCFIPPRTRAVRPGAGPAPPKPSAASPSVSPRSRWSS